MEVEGRGLHMAARVQVTTIQEPLSDHDENVTEKILVKRKRG